MSKETQIQFFENAKIRVVWDEEKEEYFFSVVDVISVLTVSADAAAYWRKLKQRLKAEGNETVTSCHTLKMSATNLRLMRLFYEAWSDLFNSSAKADELRGNNSSAAADEYQQMDSKAIITNSISKKNHPFLDLLKTTRHNNASFCE